MASASSSSRSEFIVGVKYRLMRKIGSGSFGDIYLGINITNGEVSLLRTFIMLKIDAILHYISLFIRITGGVDL